MNKRRVIAILIAFVISVAVTGMWSAATIEREGDPDVNVIEDSGSSAGSASEQKKGGNTIVKVIAGLLKVFGRMFGQKDHKLERMTEKDADKFESVGVARTENSSGKEATRVSTSATAREHLDSGREYLLSGRLNEA